MYFKELNIIWRGRHYIVLYDEDARKVEKIIEHRGSTPCDMDPDEAPEELLDIITKLTSYASPQ